MKLAHAIGLLMFISGCGSITAESVYEGIRSQQRIHTDPAMPNPMVLPPYDQYQKERENPQKNPGQGYIRPFALLQEPYTDHPCFQPSHLLKRTS
jgi:hypothetical protein